ncbi:MAG: hypothetical protein JWO95_2287 [Verrucomicrobiales bacterium]|nr:hypothetical protein [Verrucomicrobiales bacterium]
MDFLLTFFAVLALLCLAAIVVGFFWLRARIIKTTAYHQAAAIHKFPQRLTLKQLEPFAWRKLSRGSQRVESFQALGFEPLGGFTIDEIPNARMFALQHPRTGLLGLVNEYESLGTWSDALIFARGESQPILASSILRHAHFFLLPGSPKIHKQEATEQELSNAVLASAGPDANSAKVTAPEFVRLYEEAFAQSVDQRLLEPLDDCELRRLLRENVVSCCGDSAAISDKEFERIKRQYPAAIANELRLACGGQFIRETTLPASQWQEARGRLLVIHDRTPLQQLCARRLIYGAILTDTVKKRLRRHKETKPPRQTYADINASLPAWDRFKKLGEVTRPVPADIYCAPLPQKTL